jgi:hypothetical protein
MAEGERERERETDKGTKKLSEKAIEGAGRRNGDSKRDENGVKG